MTGSHLTGPAIIGSELPSSAATVTSAGWIGAALLGLLLLTAPGARAADASPEAARPPATEPRTQGDGGTSPAKPESGAAAQGESPEVFVPSEDISEDFAVSFPVDI